MLSNEFDFSSDLVKRSTLFVIINFDPLFQGATDIVEESSRRSADAERHITQQLELISHSETDRIRAEQLLNEHKRDFDRQYEENRGKLTEIGETVGKRGRGREIDLEKCFEKLRVVNLTYVCRFPPSPAPFPN
jgi:hypothetical protein